MANDEPEGELWIRVKESGVVGVDYLWPPDSESDAKELADAWGAGAVALDKAIRESDAAAKALLETWLDSAGFHLQYLIQSYNGGTSGTEGLHLLAAQMRELEAACRGYAQTLADTKNQIRVEIAINVGLFALAAVFGGPGGAAAFAARLAGQIGAKMIVWAGRVASAFDKLGDVSKFGLRFAGELAKEAGEEVFIDLAGQQLSKTQGYRDAIDPKQTLAAGLGGAIGQPLNRVVNKAGLGQATRALGDTAGRHMSRAAADHVTRGVNSFVGNGLTSPVASHLANSAVSGEWAPIPSADRIVGDAVSAGTMAASRTNTVLAGEQIHQNRLGGTAAAPDVSVEQLTRTDSPPPDDPPPGQVERGQSGTEAGTASTAQAALDSAGTETKTVAQAAAAESVTAEAHGNTEQVATSSAASPSEQAAATGARTTTTVLAAPAHVSAGAVPASAAMPAAVANTAANTAETAKPTKGEPNHAKPAEGEDVDGVSEPGEVKPVEEVPHELPAEVPAAENTPEEAQPEQPAEETPASEPGQLQEAAPRAEQDPGFGEAVEAQESVPPQQESAETPPVRPDDLTDELGKVWDGVPELRRPIADLVAIVHPVRAETTLNFMTQGIAGNGTLSDKLSALGSEALAKYVERLDKTTARESRRDQTEKNDQAARANRAAPDRLESATAYEQLDAVSNIGKILRKLTELGVNTHDAAEKLASTIEPVRDTPPRGKPRQPTAAQIEGAKLNLTGIEAELRAALTLTELSGDQLAALGLPDLKIDSVRAPQFDADGKLLSDIDIRGRLYHGYGPEIRIDVKHLSSADPSVVSLLQEQIANQLSALPTDRQARLVYLFTNALTQQIADGLIQLGVDAVLRHDGGWDFSVAAAKGPEGSASSGPTDPGPTPSGPTRPGPTPSGPSNPPPSNPPPDPPRNPPPGPANPPSGSGGDSAATRFYHPENPARLDHPPSSSTVDRSRLRMVLFSEHRLRVLIDESGLSWNELRSLLLEHGLLPSDSRPVRPRDVSRIVEADWVRSRIAPGLQEAADAASREFDRLTRGLAPERDSEQTRRRARMILDHLRDGTMTPALRGTFVHQIFADEIRARDGEILGDHAGRFRLTTAQAYHLDGRGRPSLGQGGGERSHYAGSTVPNLTLDLMVDGRPVVVQSYDFTTGNPAPDPNQAHRGDTFTRALFETRILRPGQSPVSRAEPVVAGRELFHTGDVTAITEALEAAGAPTLSRYRRALMGIFIAIRILGMPNTIDSAMEGKPPKSGPVDLVRPRNTDEQGRKPRRPGHLPPFDPDGDDVAVNIDPVTGEITFKDPPDGTTGPATMGSARLDEVGGSRWVEARRKVAPGPWDGAVVTGEGVVYAPAGMAIGDDLTTRYAHMRAMLGNRPAPGSPYVVTLHGSRSGHPIPGLSLYSEIALTEEQLRAIEELYMLSPEQVAEATLHSEYYTAGQPVQLNSCHSGSSGWAQRYADALGAEVVAPRGRLHVMPGGRLIVEGFPEGEGWARFTPTAAQESDDGRSAIDKAINPAGEDDFATLLRHHPELAQVLRETPYLANSLRARPQTLANLLRHPEAVEVVIAAVAEVAARGAEEILREQEESSGPGPVDLTETQRRAAEAVRAQIPRRYAAVKVTQPGYAPSAGLSEEQLAAYRAEYLADLYRSWGRDQKELKKLAEWLAGHAGGTAACRSEPKSRVRAQDKIDGDYAGDPSRLLDLVGALVRFDTVAEIYQALYALQAHLAEGGAPIRIVGIKDRFTNPQMSGYRDILMTVRLSNGHIAELRLHLGHIDEVAAFEHSLYEVRRDFDAVAAEQGRPISPEERALEATILRRQRELFEEATLRGLPPGDERIGP
ncbi:hypothetical protein [Amycolatopsis regifaucium]|uniref:Outer membrane channel protein CpnT-like N-terminal domain-containing protein n=1 Tax=Amycolatopsis regifaucium TaxID=546365 RepID=A0A154MB04_9PSEU|nr:hypothetical protein [Amycolatopsis regifaucium]KZB81467.1 hypothetical protein AVL48_05510 [Amycolatopsis regifaucium]OKA04730.1 hypothetical protein ATP06_0230525 [Amycolatopsis regifaucium]SFH30562.1 hypothetical protein SAMN04489731_103446 [Amycolatopsis regifaucium]